MGNESISAIELSQPLPQQFAALTTVLLDDPIAFGVGEARIDFSTGTGTGTFFTVAANSCVRYAHLLG